MTGEQDPNIDVSTQVLWYENFKKAKTFYESNGHLSTPDKTLLNWISYQRTHAMNLSQPQVALLESINYRTAGGYRKCDSDAWDRKISQLKDILEREGGFYLLPGALNTWISKQRRKARNGRLEQQKITQLTSMGIDMTGNRRNKIVGFEIRDKKYWNNQFENLKQFREMHGHCNVPQRYLEDKTLAKWVSIQRQKYKMLMNENEQVPCTPEWVKQLEDIGFEWSRKHKKTRLRGA